MAQPDLERVEYALDLLAYYLVPLDPFYTGCSRLGLNLKGAELRMLHHLDRRRGFYVSGDALVSARSLQNSIDNWPTLEVVPAAIRKIRLALENAKLPVTVSTWNGFGYCLEAPTDFKFEAIEQWGIDYAR